MTVVKPKKHLGQHFLKDENIAQKIVKALTDKHNAPYVLEIGPGTGVLTKYLLTEMPSSVFVADIDQESIDYLKKAYPNQKGQILYQDFLSFDLQQSFDGEVSIIGNFPYNISSQIVFNILAQKATVPLAVGMFQKEVAERLVAPPGNKTYGILSVLTQAFYKVEYLFTVGEQVFLPPPKVKSAVVRLVRKSTYQLSCDESLFFDVVKTAFNQRRKTLKNSLSKFHLNNEDLHEYAQERPEQLKVQDFVNIAEIISSKKFK